LRKQPSAHWLSELEAAGIPVGPVNSIADAFSDPHVIDRQTVMQLERSDLGVVPSVRLPIQFQNHTLDDGCAPPALGSSTEKVLLEAGLEESEIAQLLFDRVISS
jgi:crotonobetainyl-CoA:carnitine CoA-transferase CaiB-like acyl-CoA transferase